MAFLAIFPIGRDPEKRKFSAILYSKRQRGNLHKFQGIYILSVTVNDIMMAVIGCIRGSVYLKNYLIDENGGSNNFCEIYAILSEPFK